MAEHTNRTFICSVLFLDIVDYSLRSVTEQIALKERFNRVLTLAIAGVATDDRIILDTGDGAAVSFLGDPEDALFAGMALRDGVENQEAMSGPKLQTRVGINLGPVRLVKDINGQPNIIGDGINVAQRVMSFAEPGQILVSRSYYDVMARLSEDYAKLFHYEGAKTDKHVREHEVYAIGSAPTNLRRTGHTPQPKQALKLPALRLPRIPGFGSRSLAATLAVNSKLFVAAPLAFTLIVGTGVIARSYRSTNSEIKAAAVQSQPPQLAQKLPTEVAQPVSPQIGQGAAGTQVALPPSQAPVPNQARRAAPVPLAPPGPIPSRQRDPAAQQAQASAAVPAPSPNNDPAAREAPQNRSAEEPLAAATAGKPDTVALAPATSREPTPRDASIKILAFPWAEVYVDGQRQGVSPPLRAIPIRPGKHRIELRNSSFPAHVEIVEVKSGAEISIRHRFRR